MSAELATRNGPDAIAIEQALVQGNLAVLTPSQRVAYYHRVCESVGLNPLTKPFEYITLNGKLTLYARKDCTDQLRTLRNISIEKPDITFQDDWIVVTVQARDSSGRTDSDIGVVNKKDMQGNLGNALMKAVTKAKRRVTLSMCGLGMLDETEVETIPAARTVTTEEAHSGEVMQIPPPRNVPAEFAACNSLSQLGAVWSTLTVLEKNIHLAAKERRKAELAGEGEQSRPPSNAYSAANETAPASTGVTSDAKMSADVTKARGGLTAQSVSELLTTVADAKGEDEVAMIDEMFRTVMAGCDSLDTATSSQLAAADKWLRERAAS